MSRILFLIAAVGLMAPCSQAGMVFEKTTQKAVAELDKDEVTLRYKFKITGAKPVKIEALDVSCHCLSATSEKSLYQPGENGEIIVVMKPGAMEGEVTKPTTVVLDDPKNSTIELESVIVIPRIYEFTPLTTVWTIGDDPVAKKVGMKVVGKDPINVLKFASTRTNTSVAMKVIKPGREYEFTLTPKSTDSPELGLITLETDCKIPRYAKRQLFYTIVRKRTAN